MPMNKRYIDHAIAAIVHSETAKQMTLGYRSELPITKILLHSEIISNIEKWKIDCRKKLGLSDTTSVFGSFGFATKAKRIIPILDALKKYSDNVKSDFIYYIVGEPQKDLNLVEEVRLRSLQDKIHITGYTSLEDFKIIMGACDFCFNLRYPTQGESSASLHRMFGMGKPAVVTDVGTFSDYPDDVVLKVRYDDHEVEDIYCAISLLMKNHRELKRRSQAALEYAKTYCNLEKNAKQYAEFFQQVYDHTWQPEYEDIVIGRLCELNLIDDEYIEHIYQGLYDKKE